MTYAFNPFTNNLDNTPVVQETLGGKLRRLADRAKQADPWMPSKGYMKAVPPWQPATAYIQGNTVVNGGNLYVCVTGGTSGNSGGPTITTGLAQSSEGSCTWTYSGTNMVTTDPSLTQTNWAASTAYSLAAQVINNGLVYGCVATIAYVFTVTGVTTTPTNAAVYTNNGQTFYFQTSNITAGSGTLTFSGTGAPLAVGTLTKSSGTGDATITFASVVTATTSASSGGPTGTTNVVVDSGIVWTYMGKYTANPYANAFPTFTYTTSKPGSLLNVYDPTVGVGLSAQRVFIVAGGSSYAVNDTLTMTGGTFSQAVVLKVTSVSSGAITGVTIQTAGTYTVLPPSPVSQGSTSGSGSGATFVFNWPAPVWCKYRGVYNAGPSGVSSVVSRAYTFQQVNNLTPTGLHFAIEFYTDAPKFYFITSGANNPVLNVIIDGIRYAAAGLNNQTASTAYYLFDFTSVGGSKTRHIKIESIAAWNISQIAVDVNSTVWAPDNQDTVRAICISDSIFAGSGYGPFMPGNSVSLRIGHELGWKDVWDFSQGGTGYSNRGTGPGTTSDKFGFRIPEALTLSPDIWLIAGSVNDKAISGATVTSEVTSLLQAIRNGGSTAPIVIIGLWPINDTGVPTTETAVLAGVTAAADPLGKSYFIPVNNDSVFPWVAGTWNNNPSYGGVTNTNSTNANQYICTDNTHPPDPGTAYFARRIANAIRTNVLPLLK